MLRSARKYVLALACAVSGMLLSGCTEELPPDALRGLVEVDGSSTVFPLTEAVAEEFFLVERGVQVAVGVSGTGGGFQRFCSGQTDINDASRPIDESEIANCEANGIEFIELPVTFDGLSVVVSVENDFVECMTMEELHTIWGPEAEGVITHWNDVRPEWPDEEIALYGAGTDSGTFDFFTEAVNGETGASRTDYTPSENDNVLAQGVAGDQYTLGYFGLAYLEANRNQVKSVAVDAGEGCVQPSAETVSDGTYPLSRPLLIYVKEASAERPDVAAFVTFYLENVNFLARDVGYVPLPDDILASVQQRWEERRTGSIYTSENEGQTLEERLE